MWIDRIQIHGLRNLRNIDLPLTRATNIMIGGNAQGKTSVLEGIYLLGWGQSFRARTVRELINEHEQKAHIGATVYAKTNRTTKIEIVINPTGVIIRKNGVTQKTISRYVGTVPIVLFEPQSLEVITGGPEKRRRFLDALIGQVDKRYLYTLLNWRKILKQKNSLLRQMREEVRPRKEVLQVLNDKVEEMAETIWETRSRWLNKLIQKASDIHAALSKSSEKLIYRYGTYGAEDRTEPAEFGKWLAKQMTEKINKEISRGMALYGPHRDEITFQINKKNLGQFGSQGQKRTAVVAMKWAEVELLTEVMGEEPIFVLDDVAAELDISRQESMLKLLEKTKIQVIVSTTDTNRLSSGLSREAKIYRLVDGVAKSG